MATISLKTIEQNDNVGMFSICFDKSKESEFERFFRNEGKMSDNVKALAIDSRKLRLYCLRISDKILILGNGGVKTTRTYQENEKLSGYVMDLQTFDKVLLKAQKTGRVTIEKNMIIDIQSATFEI